MMTSPELALARGTVLLILQDFLNRRRPVAATSGPTYLVEDLLAEMLSDRGYPIPEGELGGSVLSYLKGAGLIEYRTSEPMGPEKRIFLSWRITHDGQQVLERKREDPGIKVF